MKRENSIIIILLVISLAFNVYTIIKLNNDKITEAELDIDAEGTAGWKSDGKSFDRLSIRAEYGDGKSFNKEVWGVND